MVIISFLLYTCLHIFYSQIIYSKGYLKKFLIGTMLIPFIFFMFSKHEKVITVINAGLICFYYILLLFIIKKTYKYINQKLIHKGFIDKAYSDKDFTYIQWDADLPATNDWWDEKIASKPSWLDRLITYIILLLPIVIFWFVNFITR